MSTARSSLTTLATRSSVTRLLPQTRWKTKSSTTTDGAVLGEARRARSSGLGRMSFMKEVAHVSRART
eukprot:2162397-Pyramimonas_sp.AAC.1